MSRLRLFATPSGVVLPYPHAASCGGHSRSLPLVGVGLIAALLATTLPAQTRTHAVPIAALGRNTVACRRSADQKGPRPLYCWGFQSR